MLNKPEENLYRVGIFSQMNQVTIKALRHYDEKGLLVPRYVDPENGYRYYSASQLPDLHQIIALRKIGFSLEEIRQVQQGVSKDKLLRLKKKRVLEDIAQRTRELSVIESYLADDEELVEYDIIEKALPEITVASMTLTVKTYGDLLQYMPEMDRELERLGCSCTTPQYCFNRYLDGEYKEENIQVEICEAVTVASKEDSFLSFKVIPKVEKAVCALHRGSYDNLPLSYQAILSFIDRNNYELADLPRESYIDGLWNKETNAEWLTEIQIPVRRKDTSR
ncbi:MerR family transcriptional regulator [Enterococcus sp. AZ109]|uniref:MerR family transcriptional regulator n=1 Tax=Enterococcus sp. AZ109 TaxID=2774634 RepID=UPI003F222B17